MIVRLSCVTVTVVPEERGQVSVRYKKAQKSGGEMVRQLGDEDFYKELGLTGRWVVVLAYASWCGDSRRILPVFERISNTAEFRDIAFVQVEMEANTVAKKHLGVERYPTLYLFKNGEKVVEKIAEVSAKEQEKIIMELCFRTAVMI